MLHVNNQQYNVLYAFYEVCVCVCVCVFFGRMPMMLRDTIKIDHANLFVIKNPANNTRIITENIC